SCDFARHYFRNRGFFLFLQVLRWFTSLGSLVPDYRFIGPLYGFTVQGFPIRKSPDQSLLAAPRGLSQLATSFIACFCQGIHHAPLVASPQNLLSPHLPCGRYLPNNFYDP